MAIILLTIVMPFIFLLSCMSEKKDMIEIVFDPQTSYTLKETNAVGFISDSGRTKGKFEAPTWLIYNKAADPYWYFPDGVYGEQYDSVFNIEVSIKADTAYNYVQKNLWELKGNVDISNPKGERFQTSQLFFDRDKEKFYSDSFIRITKGESVTTGIGFTSNQDLSIYDIYNSSADIPVDMKRNTANDSIPPDSLNNEIAPIAILSNEPD